MEVSGSEKQRLLQHLQLQRSSKGQLCKSLPDRDSLLQKHAQTEMYLNSRPRQTFVVLTAEVAASHRNFKDLTEMTISEMRLQTVHRGRFLLVKVIAEALNADCSMTVVQDRNGDVAKLCIYNYVPAYGFLQEALKNSTNDLEVDSVIAIKEPFFKILMDKTPAIRCDHPTDLVLIGTPEYTFEPELAKSISCWKIGDPENVATTKETAGRMYRSGRYREALALYSSAIRHLNSDADTEMKHLLYLNRAATYLQLGAYVRALGDVSQVLTSDASNEKALYRAGRAAYALRRYEKAADYFDRLIAQHPENKEAVAMREHVTQRMREARGDYDWPIMFSETLSFGGQVRLDCADFIGQVKIKEIEGRGRGLVATSTIMPGSLVLCTKAIEVAFANECSNISTLHETFVNSPTSSKLLEKLCTKMLGDEEARKRIYSLFAGYSKPRASELIGDADYDHRKHDAFSFDNEGENDSVVIDTQRVSRICFFNELAIDRPAQVTLQSQTQTTPDQSGPAGMEYGSGLWYEPALVNHSCLANCNRSFVGDLLVARATRTIKEGEEITFSYLPFYESAALRKQLFDKHQFSCDCALCKADCSDSSEELTARRNLFGRFLTEVVPRVSDPKADVMKSVDLLVSLLADWKASYARSAREDRFELINPLLALAHVYQRVEQLEQSIECLTELIQIAIPGLQFCDPEENVDGKSVIIDYEKMRYAGLALQAAVQLAALHLQVGKTNEASRWEQLAKELHKFDIADDIQLFQLRFASVLY